MKYSVPLILIAILFMFVNCKNDRSKGVQVKDIKKLGNSFTVTLNAIVRTDDNFVLYYTTDGTVNFSQNESVWLNIKGSNLAQSVTFNLPQHIKPSQLRFDLGNSTNQPPIILKRIRLSYDGKQIEIPGTLIFSYFRPNVKVTDFDATTGMIKGKMVNGVQQSPSLYPKEGPLRKIISQLTE